MHDYLPFTESYRFTSRLASTANLFYHLAIYRLMHAHPSKKHNDLKLSSAATICGIMAHTRDRAVASVGLPALAVVAECLTGRDQQDEVLILIDHIRRATGWQIFNLEDDLMTVWKQDRGSSLSGSTEGIHRYYPESVSDDRTLFEDTVPLHRTKSSLEAAKQQKMKSILARRKERRVQSGL